MFAFSLIVLFAFSFIVLFAVSFIVFLAVSFVVLSLFPCDLEPGPWAQLGLESVLFFLTRRLGGARHPLDAELKRKKQVWSGAPELPFFSKPASGWVAILLRGGA